MRRADRRDGRRDEAIDTNPLTPPNTLTHPPNPHIPSNPRTRPMCSGFPHVISRIAVVVECRPQSREIKEREEWGRGNKCGPQGKRAAQGKPSLQPSEASRPR